jgi:hypothetical protein
MYRCCLGVTYPLFPAVCQFDPHFRYPTMPTQHHAKQRIRPGTLVSHRPSDTSGICRDVIGECAIYRVL